jgi:hypothetical protein
MIRAQDILVALAIAGAAALAPAGCGGEVRYAVDKPPPPVVSEPVVAPRGEVWIPGHWANLDQRWVWHSGHFESQRSGYLFQPGAWRYSEGHYVWVEGTWRPTIPSTASR